MNNQRSSYSKILNNVKVLTEDEYRDDESIHFSDLSKIYMGQQEDLDPSKKEAINETLRSDPRIIAGEAFETYFESSLDFSNRFYVMSYEAPTNAMLNKLCDALIADDIDRLTPEVVYDYILKLDLWKSDSKPNRLKRAELPIEVTQYILERQYVNKLTADVKILDSTTNYGIVESTSTLTNRYAEILFKGDDEIFQEYQLMFEVDDLFHDLKCKVRIKTDLLTAYIQDDMVLVDCIDFKFKSAGNPLKWSKESFWKYGYWIQSLLYSKVISASLKESVEIDDKVYKVKFNKFYFAVGSKEYPNKSILVNSRFQDYQTLLNRHAITPFGTVIPSIRNMIQQLQYHKHIQDWSMPALLLNNDMIDTVNVPNYI